MLVIENKNHQDGDVDQPLSTKEDSKDVAHPSGTDVRRIPEKFNWGYHNSQRHKLLTSDPHKSMWHVDIILKNSVMDNYMLNILSGWQLTDNPSLAIENLTAKTREYPNFEFLKVAVLLKAGDLYSQAKQSEKSEKLFGEARRNLTTKHPKYSKLIESRLQKK